jgi:hypothetical protein
MPGMPTVAIISIWFSWLSCMLLFYKVGRSPSLGGQCRGHASKQTGKKSNEKKYHHLMQ